MSKAFPTDKDHIIDEMEERHNLKLTEEEYDSLRKLTDQQLFLVTILLLRAAETEQ